MESFMESFMAKNWHFREVRATALLVTIFLARSMAHGSDQQGWSDDTLVRLKAAALLQEFNATLLSNPSATRTLTQWCATHHLAPLPKIVAWPDPGAIQPPPDSVRAQLAVAPTDPIAYRRVQLRCGDKVLSEADNWYVPSRLSAEMNQLLNTTQTPFGTAVRALNFTRKTLSAELLWQPLPALWEMHPLQLQATDAPAPPPALAIPAYVLRHAAVLSKPDGQPFSYVQETYTRNIFAFPLNPD